MKSITGVLLLGCLLMCACKDERVGAHEKRIADLEAKVKSLEDSQKAKSTADVTNEAKFKQCIYSADDDFDASLKNNGTKSSKGGYSVPTAVLEQMQRQKQGRYEECKLLYK